MPTLDGATGRVVTSGLTPQECAALARRAALAQVAVYSPPDEPSPASPRLLAALRHEGTAAPVRSLSPA
jgi:hypothetical protein